MTQIGARQHYGVPRGFHYQGNIRRFYTESWCRWGSKLLALGPRSLRAFAGRHTPDLPRESVVDYTLRTEWDRFRHRNHARDTAGIYGEYLRFGKTFGEWTRADLAKERYEPGFDVFFGFNTGSLEALQLMRERGVLTIVDQIDPARKEEELVFEEACKWPGWEASAGRIPDAYFERLSAEWVAADMVLVNSEWSKNALMAQGVPAEKMLVVPVAFEPKSVKLVPKPANDGPLTVIWIGTVNLRKGIPYLIEAARMLQRSGIRFVVAGPIHISRDAMASAPPNVQFLGRLTRQDTERHYREADVFVLPTISDGFAITQVEAMAQGLPVITTPNCGQVVTHGLDGLLVPPGDSRALAEAIAKLDADRDLLRDMARQAVIKSQTFQLPSQASQIESAIQSFRRKGSLPGQS